MHNFGAQRFVSLVQEGRANLGLVAAKPDYTPDIGFESLPDRSAIGVYVGKRHLLARAKHITGDMLHTAHANCA